MEMKKYIWGFSFLSFVVGSTVPFIILFLLPVPLSFWFLLPVSIALGIIFWVWSCIYKVEAICWAIPEWFGYLVDVWNPGLHIGPPKWLKVEVHKIPREVLMFKIVVKDVVTREGMYYDEITRETRNFVWKKEEARKHVERLRKELEKLGEANEKEKEANEKEKKELKELEEYEKIIEEEKEIYKYFREVIELARKIGKKKIEGKEEEIKKEKWCASLPLSTVEVTLTLRFNRATLKDAFIVLGGIPSKKALSGLLEGTVGALIRTIIGEMVWRGVVENREFLAYTLRGELFLSESSILRQMKINPKDLFIAVAHIEPHEVMKTHPEIEKELIETRIADYTKKALKTELEGYPPKVNPNLAAVLAKGKTPIYIHTEGGGLTQVLTEWEVAKKIAKKVTEESEEK